jgi:hypothetical protein
VGDDARKLDEAVRAHPEIAYESLTLGDLTSGRAGTPFAAGAIVDDADGG